MTSYTAIAGTDIDVDSPVTTQLMTLLRDNPIAITEGSSGAPNIQTAAIAANAVTAAKIGSGAVGNTQLAGSAVTAAKLSSALFQTGTSGSFSGSGTATLTATIPTGNIMVTCFLEAVKAVSGTGTPAITFAVSNDAGSSYSAEFALGQDVGTTPMEANGTIRIGSKSGSKPQLIEYMAADEASYVGSTTTGAFVHGRGSSTAINRIRLTVTGLTGAMDTGTIRYLCFG